MALTKQRMLRYIFITELLIWGGFYGFGRQGVRALWQIRTDNAALESAIEQSRNQLAYCKRELVRWKTLTFYKEKMAREDLQMARSNETIFYLTPRV